MAKILVIEDNKQNMYLISYLLRSTGFEVKEAYTGHDGLQAAREWQPDLVLLDVQLNEENGLTIIPALKQTCPKDNMKIIVLSSFVMAGDKEKAMQAGSHGFIEKPFKPEQIIQYLNNCLSSPNQEDEKCQS